MSKNKGAGLKFGAVSMGIAMCVIGARCARAQNALGDGRALDRNLRVGSGGINTPVRDLNAQIRFNNAIVTGNAIGGKSFQGNVGYLATDDFRAGLGSDQFFAFRRDSAISAVTAAGIRGTDALRYQFALSTGQTPPAIMGNIPDFSTGLTRGAMPIHPGLPAGVETKFMGNTASSSLRSTAEFNAQQALRPSIIGAKRLPDGITTVVIASPLMGVNAIRMGAAAGSTDAADRLASAPSLTGLEAVPGYISSPINLASSVASTRVDTRVKAPQPVLDQLQRALDSNRVKSGVDAINPVVPPAAGEPEIPSWEREIERIRKALGGEDRPAAPKPGDKDPAAPATDDHPLGIRDLIDSETGKINPDVLRSLQATRPFISEFAPDEERPVADTYTAHMKNGQALLAKGRYFDAEDAFVRALALEPKDPLAIVGRAHAELGAGLFLSAGANLRPFFNEHPEMIGVRYSAGLLPSEGRAEAIVAQLRTNISNKTSGVGKEAGMLLAYMGYQLGKPELLQEGIKAFADHTDRDNTSDRLFLGLMQKMWVEGLDLPPAPPATPSPAPAPTPAPEPDQNK